MSCLRQNGTVLCRFAFNETRHQRGHLPRRSWLIQENRFTILYCTDSLPFCNSYGSPPKSHPGKDGAGGAGIWGESYLRVSNVYFGLPDRKFVNAAFMAMAIHAGLTCPITNPLVTEVRTAVLASDLALGRDEYGMTWIKDYRKRQKQ